MTSRREAFTLAELLVALAITSILVVLLVNVVAATLNVWEQGRARIDTFANARQVLGRIADEIKGAVAAGNQIEFSENLSSLEANVSSIPETSENIFFVAPYPNAASGDLCVIAYRHNGPAPTSPAPSPAPPPFSLQRAFIDSQAAWAPGVATRYRSSGYTDLDWRTIAEGVLEFEIRSHSQDDLDTDGTPEPSWNSVGSDVEMSGQVPRRAVIRIKVVNDKTLVRLKALTVASAPYDQLVKNSAREFTADVNLLPSSQ